MGDIESIIEQERIAWANGQTEKAALLACMAILIVGAEEQRDAAQAKLDSILELITEANWRTGKKTELVALIQAIEETAEGDE